MVNQQIGAFRIRRLIGYGGFAEVYFAVHETSQERVAIKIAGPYRSSGTPCYPWAVAVRLDSTREYSTPPAEPNEVLMREGEALSRVSDARFVKVKGNGFYDGRFYLVLEYVKGKSLHQRMDKGAEIPLAWFLEICDALMAAERDGLPYHGDLKPYNIIITPDSLKILDPSSTATSQGLPMRVMTPAYNPFLVRNDLAAFGCMLYELTTGFLPFPKSLLEYSFVVPEEGVDHFAGRFIPACWLNPDIPPLLDRVIMKALGLQEEGTAIIRRGGYSGISELREELASCLTEGPDAWRMPECKIAEAVCRLVSPFIEESCRQRLLNAIRFIIDYVPPTGMPHTTAEADRDDEPPTR